MNNNFKLKAELSRDCLTIFLEKEGRILGKTKIANDNHLSQKTLPILDNFFKKQKVSLKDVQNIELRSKLPDSFTSFRIVKTILETIRWEKTHST